MANGIGTAILEGCTFAEFFELVGGMRIASEIEKPRRNFFRGKAARELKRLTHMPVGRALALYERKAMRANKANVELQCRLEKERKAKLAAYRAMLAQVNAWHAPRALAGLKATLKEEIRININYDCKPVGTYDTWTAADLLAFDISQFTSIALREDREIPKERARMRNNNATVRAFQRELVKIQIARKLANTA